MSGPHGGSDGKFHGGPPPRRMPPPESTGAEARYLGDLRERRTPVVVEMVDGERFHGWVEYYDRDMVKINRTDGPNVFIRKRHIRMIHEETGS